MLQTLRELWGRGSIRALVIGISALYLPLFLFALQDISLGGRAFEFLTTDWTRMFDRTGSFTFEPIARLTLPGLTILLSPINILVGGLISLLVGLNLAVTWIAIRQPRACRFNRSTGILASVPALLAGGACCAPAIALILGLQVSSLMVSVVQVLIPVSVILLLITLGLILARTNPELIE
ncbi:MAG: hypothetical protein EA351_12825 [Gemmatimonadales bacterium]|nr:MAG: hypothetical protein EA351_12825 [Gemmatimonadales bacterium]